MNRIDKYTIDLIFDKENKIELLKEEYPKVIKKLKKNKISFIELLDTNQVNRSFFECEEFTKANNAEIVHYNNWRSEFFIIKKKWEVEGIDYIFHKSVGKFPYLSDNLDILVKQKDFKRAGEILVEIGYVDLRNIQEAHKEFYRKFDGNRVVCPIHLHERVCWSVPYEDNKHLWKNYLVSSDDELVHYPCYDDALLINTAHCFLEDHLIKIYDLLTIKSCMNNIDVNWEYIYKTAEKLNWRQSLHTGFIIFNHLYFKLFQEEMFPKKVIENSWNFINKIGWISKKLKNILIKEVKMPFSIPHLWTRFHSSKRILKDETFGSKFDRFYIVITHLFDGFIHNKLQIKPHPPLFVVFSGIDGCGKSSHINTLLENHRTCDIKTNVIWSRAGSLPVINKLLKMARFFKSNSEKKEIKKQDSRKKKSLPKNPVTIYLWRLLNSWEMILWYFIKIRIPLIFGKSIIADRYIYDSIIDMEILSNSAKYNRPIYKLLELLTPKPDVIFNLNVNLDNIISRGVDESRDELAAKEKHYKKFLSTKDVIEINNNNDFNSVNSNLTTISLKKLFDKHPEKYKCYKVVSFRYK
ncbi:MAG: nucleotidyltransferase family protein [Candidatus Tenebribacter burtonii]|nr:nucleotidyltransferase family protein [Candidatus Tenebribacter burtonii]